ncbi:hypothetical protein EI77_04287 [Prosthecobacter fusiformis]|uniref:Uncharacterized protein n=2 Tax=Prosthecobacter fusiformis TaxID=48464 RepID=A0A4R7RL00_9BACT|nr:hypothetical protein EI77_04287 [Prosthecobacter fusiformis]
MSKGRVKKVAAGEEDAPEVGLTGDVSGEDVGGEPMVGRAFDGGFSRWLEWAQELGLGPGERVWELHVVQGRSVGETGRLLGLAGAEVMALCAEMRARLAARAPRAEADFHAVREELRDRLVSILEDASRARDDPRLLAVRQRVCDQLAELYGLKMQRRAAAEETAPPYQLTGELGVVVGDSAANVHGRSPDIAGAKKGLGLE